MVSISQPARERLMYLSRLLESSGETAVTSGTIAGWTGWTRATIRKDFSLLGISCGAAKGYDRLALRDAIRTRLASDENAKTADAKPGRCCIVGLGGIGGAFARDARFGNSAFRIAAGFDRSVNRIETLDADFPLYPASRLEEIVRRLGIEYAILAESEEHAVVMAKRLAAAGIKGIVNATSAALPVGGKVRVENISVIAALEKLRG
jgi:redox-sensing transcriptional repressor